MNGHQYALVQHSSAHCTPVDESVRRALLPAENAAGGEGGDPRPVDGGIQLPGLDPVPLTFTAIQTDDMSSDPIAKPSA